MNDARRKQIQRAGRGGRQPGTPNKTTALINTAFDPSIPPNWRFRAAQAAAPHVHPKAERTQAVDPAATAQQIECPSKDESLKLVDLLNGQRARIQAAFDHQERRQREKDQEAENQRRGSFDPVFLELRINKIDTKTRNGRRPPRPCWRQYSP